MANEEYTKEELLEIIDGLEFELEYADNPADRVQLQNELNCLRRELNIKYGENRTKDIELDNLPKKDYSQPLDIETSSSFDSNSTSYGRPQVQKAAGIFKPTPQGMKSGEDEIPPAGNMNVARQQVFGKTHASLNYCDALRTMGYSEDRIKAMCKEEGIKYNSPMFNDSSKPKVAKKNPVQKHNPVQKPNTTIKRIWN